MNKAPFTKEKVEELNNRQNDPTYHPYTCAGDNIKECKRSLSYDARRNGEKIEYSNDNEGVLIATEQGWICPCGKYKQDWSH